MTVIKDLVSEQKLRRDVDGYTVERSFIVTGVSGQGEARLYNATITSGIPQYGEPHPIIPDVQVTNIDASTLESGKDIMVNILYGIPSDEEAADAAGTGVGTIEVSSNLVSEQRFADINGVPLTATHRSAFGILVQSGTVDVQKPQQQVSFTRMEPIIPKNNINNFLGKVNDKIWSSYPAKTWLLSAISVREIKGEFEVLYTFSHDINTWRAVVTALLTQADADAFPLDEDTGNGIARYDVYETANFDQLGLFF